MKVRSKGGGCGFKRLAWSILVIQLFHIFFWWERGSTVPYLDYEDDGMNLCTINLHKTQCTQTHTDMSACRTNEISVRWWIMLMSIFWIYFCEIVLFISTACYRGGNRVESTLEFLVFVLIIAYEFSFLK